MELGFSLKPGAWVLECAARFDETISRKLVTAHHAAPSSVIKQPGKGGHKYANQNKYETKPTDSRDSGRDCAGWLCFGECARDRRCRSWLSRTPICHAASDEIVEPDGRPTGQGSTTVRSGETTDHRNS